MLDKGGTSSGTTEEDIFWGRRESDKEGNGSSSEEEEKTKTRIKARIQQKANKAGAKMGERGEQKMVNHWEQRQGEEKKITLVVDDTRYVV